MQDSSFIATKEGMETFISKEAFLFFFLEIIRKIPMQDFSTLEHVVFKQGILPMAERI